MIWAGAVALVGIWGQVGGTDYERPLRLICAWAFVAMITPPAWISSAIVYGSFVVGAALVPSERGPVVPGSLASGPVAPKGSEPWLPPGSQTAGPEAPKTDGDEFKGPSARPHQCPECSAKIDYMALKCKRCGAPLVWD
jgi:hypothetical protein